MPLSRARKKGRPKDRPFSYSFEVPYQPVKSRWRFVVFDDVTTSFVVLL